MKANDKKLTFTKIECADNLSAVEDAIYVLGGKWKCIKYKQFELDPFGF